MPCFHSHIQRVNRRLACSLTALGLLVTVSTAQAQTPAATFGTVTTYGTGANSGPRSIAVADVNGDGKLDLLTANFNTNTAGVLLGTGTGTFGTATTYSTGADSNFYNIAVADVNGDGKLDLLTANYSSNTAGVLLGTGKGTFGTATIFSTGADSQPHSIAVADVNGDGKLDLLTANYNNSTAGVLLGTGTGTFGTVTTFSTGANSGPHSIAVADVNGDGKLDLLTANYDTNTTGVLLGTGMGTFGTVTTFSTGANSSPFSIAVADVNGDGKLDLLTANFNTNTAGVLLGTGTGTFGTATTYSTGADSNFYNIAVADVNGDGKLDLLTANYSSNTAGVLLGTGTGTFGTVTTYSTGDNSYPSNIAVADVNGDGKPDLLTANFNTNEVGVLLGTVLVAPTLTSLSPTSGPVGSSITLTGTDLSGATGVSFNGTAATSFAVVNATTVTANVPTSTTTGPVTVTTPNGTSNGVTFTVITDLVVTTTTPIAAGTYNTITVNSPGVGTLAGNVSVTTSTTVNSGATLHDGCAIISGAGSFTLAAGGTLGICTVAGITASGSTGAVQVTGLRSFSPDASYVYNGSDAQVTGSGLPSQVRSLTTTNNSPVRLSNSVAINRVLTVGGAGNLNLNGQALTLLSSSVGSALVVNAGTGLVSGGTATVQRYLDPAFNYGMGYRHYSAPVSGSTVADLATPTGFTPVINESYNTSAAPGTVTPFPTVFGYDQNRLAATTNNYPAFDKGFYSPRALTDALVVGQGYAVQIGADQLVDFTGQLNTGPKTLTLNRAADAMAADAGWALVGNPYPAPLDWRQVAPADRASLDGSIYVVQSTGPYTGSYRAYVNNLSTSGPNSPLIGTGQGFFVRVSAGQTSGTLTFRNSQRVTDYASQAPVYRTTADPRPLVRLELRTSTGQVDGLAVYAEAGATPRFDAQYDAGKLVNPTGLNLASLSAAQEPLAIDGRPAFTAATVVPLTVGVPAAGTYSLAAATLANLPAGLEAYLTDAQTGQTVRLAPQSTYSFSVTATEAIALLTSRFTLRFQEATPLATAPALVAIAEVALYPNPASQRFTVRMPAIAGASQVQATLFNTLGQVVRRQAAALPATGATFTVEAGGLSTGVYTLRLQAGTSTVAKRVILQ
jgi:uncharacterized protein (DUF2141 family)